MEITYLIQNVLLVQLDVKLVVLEQIVLLVKQDTHSNLHQC